MNQHTKFDVSSCTHSRNVEGVTKLKKSWSRDVDHAPFDPLLHFLVCRPRGQSAKGTSLGDVASFESSRVKISRRV